MTETRYQSIQEENFSEADFGNDVSFSSSSIRKADYTLALRPESLEYEKAVIRFMVDKLSVCSTAFKHHKCVDCGKEWQGTAIYTCGLSYCWECREMRTKKIYKRLMSKDIRNKRVFHMILGLPRIPLPELSRNHLKELRGLVARFVKSAARRGYYIKGWYVIDFAVDSADTVFLHAHIVTLPFKGSNRCAAPFNETITKLTGGVVKVVKVVGYRSKSNAFYYLSKRAAGVLGHYEDFGEEDRGVYGFKDFLSLRDWNKLLFKRRGVTQFGFPEGIGSNTAPVDEDVCPFCGSHNVQTIGIVLVKRSAPSIPPDLRGFFHT